MTLLKTLSIPAPAGIAAVLGALLPAAAAPAQTYPSQPVKRVVPFPAGSATDNIARILGKELQDDLGQPFLVDNRPGAQRMVGSDIVAKAAPDGHSLRVAAVSFAAIASMVRKVPFDPVADFTPVSRMATTHAWLATLGPKGLPEAIARRLHEATVRAMAKPDVQARLATLGFTPALMGPADAAPFIKAEVGNIAMMAALTRLRFAAIRPGCAA